MKKLPLSQIEQFIQDNKDQIHSLDEKELPMVLADLQAEQAQLDKVKDHRQVKDISMHAFMNVFPCYSLDNLKLVELLFTII